ncbi:uncharacterized protein LOC130733164 isoform X2 [Lotus japonicus]|uniref:uncharacterized protein LOC130733164 isoform X2 n=1 Tax=Lotus japonicus TaxID=34305 RepID=UPI00258C90AE|nr:uncharacterized protein LOC130733164 isoform X2 [Lotus japonicus]
MVGFAIGEGGGREMKWRRVTTRSLFMVFACFTFTKLNTWMIGSLKLPNTICFCPGCPKCHKLYDRILFFGGMFIQCLWLFLTFTKAMVVLLSMQVCYLYQDEFIWRGLSNKSYYKRPGLVANQQAQ